MYRFENIERPVSGTRIIDLVEGPRADQFPDGRDVLTTTTYEVSNDTTSDCDCRARLRRGTATANCSRAECRWVRWNYRPPQS